MWNTEAMKYICIHTHVTSQPCSETKLFTPYILDWPRKQIFAFFIHCSPWYALCSGRTWMWIMTCIFQRHIAGNAICFETSSSSPQWRNVQQMQLMWLCLFSGRRFKDTYCRQYHLLRNIILITTNYHHNLQMYMKDMNNTLFILFEVFVMVWIDLDCYM